MQSSKFRGAGEAPGFSTRGKNFQGRWLEWCSGAFQSAPTQWLVQTSLQAHITFCKAFGRVMCLFFVVGLLRILLAEEQQRPYLVSITAGAFLTGACITVIGRTLERKSLSPRVVEAILLCSATFLSTCLKYISLSMPDLVMRQRVLTQGYMMVPGMILIMGIRLPPFVVLLVFEVTNSYVAHYLVAQKFGDPMAWSGFLTQGFVHIVQLALCILQQHRFCTLFHAEQELSFERDAVHKLMSHFSDAVFRVASDGDTVTSCDHHLDDLFLSPMGDRRLSSEFYNQEDRNRLVQILGTAPEVTGIVNPVVLFETAFTLSGREEHGPLQSWAASLFYIDLRVSSSQQGFLVGLRTTADERAKLLPLLPTPSHVIDVAPICEDRKRGLPMDVSLRSRSSGSASGIGDDALTYSISEISPFTYGAKEGHALVAEAATQTGLTAELALRRVETGEVGVQTEAADISDISKQRLPPRLPLQSTGRSNGSGSVGQQSLGESASKVPLKKQDHRIAGSESPRSANSVNRSNVSGSLESEDSEASRILTGVRIYITLPGAMVSYDSGVRLFGRKRMKALRSLLGHQTLWKTVEKTMPSEGLPSVMVDGCTGTVEAALRSPFKPSEAMLSNLSKIAIYDLISHWNFLEQVSCCHGHAVISRLHNIISELEPQISSCQNTQGNRWRPHSGWQCGNCTAVNATGTMCCGICEAELPDESEESEPDDSVVSSPLDNSGRMALSPLDNSGSLSSGRMALSL